MPVVLAAIPVEIVVAAAILAILYVWMAVVVPRIQELVRPTPFVGPSIADAIGQNAKDAVNWAAGWVQTGINALVQIVSVPVNWVAGIINTVVDWASGVVASLVTAYARIASAIATEAAHYATALQAIVANATRLTNLLASLPGTIAADAGKLVDQARQALTAAIAAAVAIVAKAVTTETSARSAADAGLASKIASEAAAGTAALSVAVAGVTHLVDTKVAGVEGQVVHLATDVVPAVAATAAAATAVVAAEVATLRVQCIDPLCGVFGPSLGTFALFGDLATLLVVGGLVGEAVRDPNGTAHLVAAGIADVEGLASGLVGAFAGVNL